MSSILDAYSTGEPNFQSTVDIFQGEWTSKLPGDIRSGWADLFDDPRVAWAAELFGLSGQEILELGPLEGGHTYSMHRMGANKITAVEGNSRAFLKCLIVKELYDLDRVKFVYGDILKFLESTDKEFDIILASGVLYHMTEPLRLLYLIAQHTNRCLIWSHYYDEQILRANWGNKFAKIFGDPIEIHHLGYRCFAHTQFYGEALERKAFCGGNSPASLWVKREDILGFLRHVGFDEIKVNHEHQGGQNGPSFSVAAYRT